MYRDDYATRGEVETAITLMGGGISEEHAGGRARRQLVASSGGHIWVTEAPKNPKKGVIRWRAVQQREGNAILDGRARAPIQEIGGRAEGLGPVRGRHVRMNEQSVNDVIQRSKNTLGFAILLGGVRAREAQLNVTGAKECS